MKGMPMKNHFSITFEDDGSILTDITLELTPPVLDGFLSHVRLQVVKLETALEAKVPGAARVHLIQRLQSQLN